MALFGFKKKEEVLAKPAKAAPKSSAAVAVRDVPEKAKVASAAKSVLYGVLIEPHITEKATSGVEHGWYAFRVANNADKPTIKRAVEGRYGVRVLRVRVLNRRPRTIRLGRTEGVVPGFKNAMVKLAQGQSIEFT